LLNGLLVPTAGSVRVGDWDTREVAVSSLAQRVGYLFQDPRRQVFLETVRDEVAFGPANLGLPADEVERRCQHWLNRLELSQLAGRHPYDLGESQLRRLALASVLALESDFLVLDEPTASVDERDWCLLSELVGELVGQGRGVVVITHDMEFAAEHFERAVVLEAGQVRLDGPTEEVFRGRLTTAIEAPVATRFSLALGFEPPAVRQETFLAYLKSEAGERLP
ncbi:MAG: ABC transporter ATP-binding protein, partial [Candidatus Eremiobacteraeota bacterium]|nr:ABC transporter ATP-binding protein [Candidatus Eremiobacteraeota bacterium]